MVQCWELNFACACFPSSTVENDHQTVFSFGSNRSHHSSRLDNWYRTALPKCEAARNAKLREINNKRLVSTEDATYKPLDCPFSLVWTPTCFAIEGSAGEAPVEIYTADYSEYRISQLSSSKFDQFSKNALQKLYKNPSTPVFFFQSRVGRLHDFACVSFVGSRSLRKNGVAVAKIKRGGDLTI